MTKLALMLLPLAFALGACDTMNQDPYGPSGYPPAPYPGPETYPQPYPPQPYPGPETYPQPYPPQPYPGSETYPPAPYPPAAGIAPPLDRTRWAVVAINGRPTPRQGEFAMEFDAGRLSAKFGCNSLGAGYIQTGASLDAGVIIATRMACPDMSWETQGSAVLDQVMQVSAMAANRITLTSSAGSIELMRR